MEENELDALRAQCAAIGWVKPSRRERLFESTPRVGQYFWIDFPHDAYAPEFYAEHPGIVVRGAKRRTDPCIIVPLTSKPQESAEHIHKLSSNPNPDKQRHDVWAVCNHLYTVSIGRLRPCRGKFGNYVFPRASSADMTAIFLAIKAAMPQIP